MSLLLLLSENPMTVELEGDIGFCNLLVRAVQLCGPTCDAADSDRSFCYVAQELRRVDDIDGSVMQLMLAQSLAEQSVAVCSSSAAESVAVKQLLHQFPSVLPASLPQFLANPSASPAVCGEFRLWFCGQFYCATANAYTRSCLSVYPSNFCTVMKRKKLLPTFF